MLTADKDGSASAQRHQVMLKTIKKRNERNRKALFLPQNYVLTKKYEKKYFIELNTTTQQRT